MAQMSDDFRTLLDGVLAGRPEAAEQFCKTYQSHILRVVRRRLLKRLRGRFDSMDFVQDVWASFFAEPPQDHRFENPGALIGYLERMAQYKVVECQRQQTRQRKNVLREQPIDTDGPDADGVPQAQQPTASQEFYAQERLEQMLRDLPVQHRSILQLLSQGWTYREIAERLNTTERTIHRVVRRIEHEWEQREHCLTSLAPLEKCLARLLREGLTYREIADRWQMPEPHIERLVRRLKHKVPNV